MRAILSFFLLALFLNPLMAKEEKTSAKEPGIYIKTDQGMTRLLPNIVFNEKGVLFIEMNDPPHFLIRDFQSIILSGKYDFKVLTVNPMLHLQASPLGKQRFLFGKDVSIEIKQTSTDLHTVKWKGLVGRGYYSLWINENAWDFILD